MLKYLIATVMALLMNAIIISEMFGIAGLRKSKSEKVFLRTGTASGIGLAILVACITHFSTKMKRGYWNIWFMIIAIAAGIIYLIFMWGLLRKKAPRFNSVMCGISGFVLVTDLIGYCLPSVILYPSEFILSDESIASTEFLLKFIGLALGFLLVILAMVAVYKVSVALKSLPVKIFFTAAMGLLFLRCSGTLIQSMFNRWIKISSGLFNYSTAIVNNNVPILIGIIVLIIILPIILIAISIKHKEPYNNPAQGRKIKSRHRNMRRWAVFLIVLFGISIFTVTVVKAYDEREVTLSPAEPFEQEGDEVQIPVERIEDGHLHRFAFKASDGTEVRFIVIKKNEMSYGVGLDACDICGQTGYFERDGQVVCKLCDVVMNKSTIGFKGGCNPIPLTYTMSNGKMIIQAQDLENEKGRFK